jgi:hypothetical protein
LLYSDHVKRAAVIFAALALAAGLTKAAADEIVPLIQMEDVPLTEALRQMARKAQLNVILDPRLSAAPYNAMTVSIRWENVTAREALIALLDNYGLVFIESPRSRAR